MLMTVAEAQGHTLGRQCPLPQACSVLRHRWWWLWSERRGAEDRGEKREMRVCWGQWDPGLSSAETIPDVTCVNTISLPSAFSFVCPLHLFQIPMSEIFWFRFWSQPNMEWAASGLWTCDISPCVSSCPVQRVALSAQGPQPPPVTLSKKVQWHPRNLG
jgi:hypothetical protein